MVGGYKIIFFASILITVAANAGFLTAEKFPTTVNDVSFSDRTENKAAGYAPYKDASAYLSIELQSLNEALVDEVEIMEKEHEIYCMGPGANKPECMPYVPATTVTTQPVTEQTSQQNSNNDVTVATVPQATPTGNSTPPTVTQAPATTPQAPTGAPGAYCAQRHPYIPAGQTVPLGVPISPDLPIYGLAQKGQVCAPYGGVRGNKNGKTVYHEGVDLGCTMGGRTAASYHGTPIFAIADGVVSSVRSAKQCKSSGNMIRITHADGFYSYYMHLDTILVTQGQQVQAGCQIGTMGHTGGARVQKCPSMGIDLTHLHYELGNKSKPGTLNTPKGPIKLKYIGTSIDPTDMLKYK